MASSSTSSDRKSFKYQVFISFRGEDAPKTFVDHLYASLKRHGIHTFRDNEELEKGNKIDELFKAIEESRLFIIVFSKNYASSSWCLKEITKIMECQDGKEQTACPLFYDVEPSDIREQIGPVGTAIAKNKTTNEQIKKWKEALRSAVNVAGWQLKKIANRHEAEAIDLIVKEISLMLRSIHLGNDENLIGMERRMQELESSLGIGLNNEVRMIGIKGMGGIGKTTLATAIFDKISSQFEGKSFVENVREASKERGGLLSLQKKVIRDVLSDDNVNSVQDAISMMKDRMLSKKVLLVLDDVDHTDQLEALAGALDWFKGGSRIIVTARDKQVLTTHRVNTIHDINFLSDEEAISLFSRYAFMTYIPLEGYGDLSFKVVKYAAGLPLTLKVLGSLLRGREKAEWINILKSLETIPETHTLGKLEISYDGLDDDQKEIFLDVACFMNGQLRDDAVQILECCGFHPQIDLEVLEHKSLLTISNGRLCMHNRIEEMGRWIVRRSHRQQPSQHSRLWIWKEIEDILTNDLGTEVTRYLQLSGWQLSPDIVMNGFGKMKRLACLIVESPKGNNDLPFDWKFDKDRIYLPNALRFLKWVHYPFRCLPQTFEANNLVALKMPYSKIIQLWEGGERKVLNNLRFLDLSYSTLTTLDLELTPNIEWLELKECHDLVELHMPLGSLKRLVHLDLIGTLMLESSSLIKQLESFKLPSLLMLELIALSTSIKCLPKGICMLKHLRSLKLKSCELLEELPRDLGQLECLEKLSLLSTSIKCLPDSICMLKHLRSLKLKSCELLEELPQDLGQLECLEKLSLLSTSIKCLPDSICMLKHLRSLKLESCKLLEELPEDLGRLECLEKLILRECKSLKHIPNSICNMKCLKELNVKSTRISQLPQSVSSLEGLRIVGSEALLQSCVFATEIQTLEDETFCYIQAAKQRYDFSTVRPFSILSTSSNQKSFKYDVFLSFRGKDTSDTFVRHLHAALQQQGTHTYMDDKRMEQERNIDDELMRSIAGSKFIIIIFSKKYVSSSLCLDELVKIMEFHKTTMHTAYPVFYDVEPSEVRNQSGADTGIWRQALKEAAELAGCDMTHIDWNETEFIKQIVEDIWLKLRSINVDIDEKRIGMERQIEEIFSSLRPGVGDVCMIGITGIGGVGKTNLAEGMFERMSFAFEGKSFVQNVREYAKPSLSGLKSLQEKVLSDVLAKKDITISSVSEGKITIEKELGDRMVLLVLDDVDQIEQLHALAGASNWFGKGSMIIITSRNEKMLIEHGVEHIHHVPRLTEKEALRLFCLYAFLGDKPVEGYEKLSLEVVRCSSGLPLEIKVLGSLFRDKSMTKWIDWLNRRVSSERTLEILEESYNSLKHDNKDIFLDIACFLNRLREKDAVRMLEGCGFRATDGLRVLVRKSLLTISDDQRLDMLGPITEMGRGIVRRAAANQPSQHSRLWIRKEIEDILANQQGTKETRGVQLLETQLSSKIVMEGVEHMEALRSLVVGSKKADDDLSCDWNLDVDRQYLPNALRFLRWVHYPIPSLPEKFRADNLVSLEMPHSRITQLWEGGERPALNNLRFLDLSHSTLTTLDLKLTPRLEWLELKECRDLEDLLTPDGSLRRLVHLDLIGCSNFDSLSFIKRLESLELLSLSKLHLTAKRQQQSSKRSDNLPWLEFTCAYSEEVPSSSRCALKSVSLNLKRSKKLERLSGNIVGLQHLRHLTLDGDIPEVPNDLHVLPSLEKLYLSLTRIKCLPDSICMLKHLKSLKLKSCELLEELPKELGQLECLEMLSLSSARITHVPDSICMLKSLKSLKLKYCLELKWLPRSLGNLQQLEKLNVLSARIGLLPNSICMLECLKSLELECCNSLERLPYNLGKLKCLEKLILAHCASLGEIPNSICNMKNLKRFSLYKCDKVKELPDQLGLVRGLEELNLIGTGIRHIPRSICSVGNLRIFGSVRVLESCDFEPEIQNPEGETFCNTPVREQLPREATE